MPPRLQPESAPLHVLVADDDASIRRACCEIAANEGMVAHEAELSSRARELLLAKGVDILLVDETIATGAGFELLDELRQMRPDVAVVWMTSASTVQLALEALRFGASDYLIKPFSARGTQHGAAAPGRAAHARRGQPGIARAAALGPRRSATFSARARRWRSSTGFWPAWRRPCIRC